MIVANMYLNGGEIMKRCEICGELFVPNCNRQKVCKKDHFNNCPICGKQVVWNSVKPVMACSEKCKEIRRISTLKERYGVTKVGEIRKSTNKGMSYDTIGRLRSLDSSYRKFWSIYKVQQIPAKEVKQLTGGVVVDPLDLSYFVCYPSKDDKYAEFLQKYGLNQAVDYRYKYAYIVAYLNNDIVQCLQVGRSRLKGFECCIINLGVDPYYRVVGEYSQITKELEKLFEIKSMYCIAEKHWHTYIDLCSMGMEFKMDRPGIIKWSNEAVPAKRPDKIDEGLMKGLKLIQYPDRIMFGTKK